ncbi:sugar phosphate isomerase/epimerase family protein [Anaerocolumna sp. MB42-C2]|uniref:sugar phosphate isomerase/epimerase family protein n=1 Tax=Anaerocolumna sp. MB42-C2 TaxID=3070997 RepID=UPI0027E0CF19|nr:sugar phosphate isomerase/epimerase [Anaerocolumna sp. MB42-C2]WMJ87510.1 sugar phosphate isomerase/epimerase [Anaerocolumna sp. MB42-C2]
MKLGAQLYTVRNYIQNEKDFYFTVTKIAEMGYTTVQISGIGKEISPTKIREICDSLSLEIVLTHSDVNRILYDTENLIREHDIMGCKYIGLGAMPEKYRTPFWVSHFAEDFKEPAKKIAAAGKLFMYHNHHFEFEKMNGKYAIDYLLEAFTPEEMGITMDTYWVQAAGGDVCQWIEVLKDRLSCVHLKDMAVVNGTPVMAPVMEGNLNFSAIIDKLKQTNCEYLLVEQDICQGSPFDCLKLSYDNLRNLGYR